MGKPKIYLDVPKPDISVDFTLEDIRKIRAWHHEMLKDATNAERRDFYRRGSRNYGERAAALGVKGSGQAENGSTPA